MSSEVSAFSMYKKAGIMPETFKISNKRKKFKRRKIAGIFKKGKAKGLTNGSAANNINRKSAIKGNQNLSFNNKNKSISNTPESLITLNLETNRHAMKTKGESTIVPEKSAIKANLKSNVINMKKSKVVQPMSPINSNLKKCSILKLNGEPAIFPKKRKNLRVLTKDDTPILVNENFSSSEKHVEDAFEPILHHSVEEGKKLFAWLIDPYNVDDFFENVWEKKPLYITRKSTTFYCNIISSPAIDKILRNDVLEFTKNIDITSYSDGKRETHNPVGRALPHVVWDYYLNGCSIRLLNPQTYIHRLHLLNTTLQEFFNCFVGANAYLTPPDSQGFAPHYDDIEAFILQIEGKKKWRVYPPRSVNETLPRLSSNNFDQSDIGEPVMEITLEPGDLLYFPRGFIHQAVTVDGVHSLHVTLSCYQKHSWADLFEKMVTAGVQMAVEKDVELRRGLPMDIYDHLGLVHSDSDTPRRTELLKRVQLLFGKVLEYLPIDDAVDQMYKQFMHDALPPIIMEPERQRTVYGDTDVMTKNGVIINRVEIFLHTKIRLTRSKILRMVMESEAIRLYYYSENSKEYHGNDLQYLEIEESMAPAVETLIKSYPEYVSVEQLETESDIEKIQLATTLWEKGLIMVDYPLHTIPD